MMNQKFELNDPLASFKTFTETMRQVIENKEDKHGDFTKWDSRTMFKALWREFQELVESYDKGLIEPTEQECIDVANVAYMLYYHVRLRQ